MLFRDPRIELRCKNETVHSQAWKEGGCLHLKFENIPSALAFRPTHFNVELRRLIGCGAAQSAFTAE
ncbi:hypothetical protein AOLI_G00054430 [Acnodon oligacanthus]